MQLKEKEIRLEGKLALSRYTSPFSLFSSIDPKRFEKQLGLYQPKPIPHIIFPRPKTAYREIFVFAENRISNHRIGARWYDPEIGVWTTPDPAYQYPNPYSYCGGDPINFIDNDGEVAVLTLALIAGGVAIYNSISTYRALNSSGLSKTQKMFASGTAGVVTGVLTYMSGGYVAKFSPAVAPIVSGAAGMFTAGASNIGAQVLRGESKIDMNEVGVSSAGGAIAAAIPPFVSYMAPYTLGPGGEVLISLSSEIFFSYHFGNVASSNQNSNTSTNTGNSTNTNTNTNGNTNSNTSTNNNTNTNSSNTGKSTTNSNTNSSAKNTNVNSNTNSNNNMNTNSTNGNAKVNSSGKNGSNISGPKIGSSSKQQTIYEIGEGGKLYPRSL